MDCFVLTWGLENGRGVYGTMSCSDWDGRTIVCWFSATVSRLSMSSSYAARRGLKDGYSKSRFSELDSMMLMDDKFHKLDGVYWLCIVFLSLSYRCSGAEVESCGEQ